MENKKMRDFMHSNYGDEKANKSVELNESMTITDSKQDEYTRTIKNIGGGNNE